MGMTAEQKVLLTKVRDRLHAEIKSADDNTRYYKSEVERSTADARRLREEATMIEELLDADDTEVADPAQPARW